METLPTSPINTAGGIEYQQYPSRTWNVNTDTQRIEGDTDRLPSVQQAAEIILNTQRFRWQIYRPFSGVHLEDLIGQESDFVGAELQRRIKEALAVDERIQGISDFSFYMKEDSMMVQFRVNTVYGLTDPVEVTIS